MKNRPEKERPDNNMQREKTYFLIFFAGLFICLSLTIYVFKLTLNNEDKFDTFQEYKYGNNEKIMNYELKRVNNRIDQIQDKYEKLNEKYEKLLHDRYKLANNIDRIITRLMWPREAFYDTEDIIALSDIGHLINNITSIENYAKNYLANRICGIVSNLGWNVTRFNLGYHGCC